MQRHSVVVMPSMRQSYTVTMPEEPVLSLFSKEIRRKSPSVSGSMLVSTFVGLLINQAKVREYWKAGSVEGCRLRDESVSGDNVSTRR